MSKQEFGSNTFELQNITNIAINLFQARSDQDIIVESTLLRMKMDQFRERLRRQRIIQLQLKKFDGTIVKSDVFEDSIISFQNEKLRQLPDNLVDESQETTSSDCEYQIMYQMQELKNGLKRFYIQ